jgi:micrococcal nuclease
MEAAVFRRRVLWNTRRRGSDALQNPMRYNAGKLMARRRSSDVYRRRRRFIRLGAGAALLLLAAGVLADHWGVFGGHGDDRSRYDRRQAVVVRIIDGDTFVARVDSSGEEMMMHLLGADAPDLHFGEHLPADYWAQQARDYLVEKLENQTVTLRLEPLLTRDRFGRLLVYAYLSDTDNLNLDLVRDGCAYADRRVKHSLAAAFESAEAEARRRRNGLWEAITVQQMPPWRRHWLEERKKGTTGP